MTNEDILTIARKQSAAYLNCEADDFLLTENKVVIPKNPRYRNLPFVCEMVSYGSNVVAATREEYAGEVTKYLSGCMPHSAMEFPRLTTLGRILDNAAVCDQAIFFLPDLTKLTILP